MIETNSRLLLSDRVVQRNGLLSNHSLFHSRGYQALSLIYFQVPLVRDMGAELNEGRVVCESKLSSPERLGELTRRLHYLHQNHLQLLVFLSDIGAFSSKQQKKQFWHRFRDLLLAPANQYFRRVVDWYVKLIVYEH